MDNHYTQTSTMKSSFAAFLAFLLLFVTTCTPSQVQAQGTVGKGQWKLLQQNIGIAAMHMQLLRNDRVVIYDRTDFGASNITLPGGRCRNDANDLALKVDCTAHSIEYDVATNTIRPLFIQTNVWCSSGSVTPDGVLIQTGGFNDGERMVRTFNPCSNCDWQELGAQLAVPRWYSTHHILPDGRHFIVGGRGQFNYEFHPKNAATQGAFDLPFLSQTTDPNQVENNLYPFVFLNVDGNLFIFANNRSILFDYNRNQVVREYPVIPGGDPRNYPSSGSAVLLPLNNIRATSIEVEILICGGAPRGSFERVNDNTSRAYLPALNTCGRMIITDPNPQWVMETMPNGRVMSDMVILPNGNILIINGATSGTAGWENGRNPTFSPFLYQPNQPATSRFVVQSASSIPRLYHSTAILLRDGRVLVGGSDPHERYRFGNVLFPTELRMEAFSPAYLDPQFINARPTITYPPSQVLVAYGQRVNVRFIVTGTADQDLASVTMLAPSFNTHSFSQNQRMLVLWTGLIRRWGTTDTTYQATVVMPMFATLAPPGYYLLFVVHQDIPSEGIWIHIQ